MSHQLAIPSPDRIPATIQLTLLPQLGAITRFDHSWDDLPVTQYGLSVPSFPWAHANAIALNAEHRRRSERDPGAAIRLLEWSPYFELEPWVVEAQRRYVAIRLASRRPGRPIGSMAAMPRGMALVRYVDALRKTTGESPTKVCTRLGEEGRLGFGAERARELYREWKPEAEEGRRSALMFTLSA